MVLDSEIEIIDFWCDETIDINADEAVDRVLFESLDKKDPQRKEIVNRLLKYSLMENHPLIYKTLVYFGMQEPYSSKKITQH